MSSTDLYTDLSGYYDLLCADIDYQQQSNFVRRLYQLFGSEGKRHLDMACGTGQHIQHLLEFGFESSGFDLNQPMLDIAQARCPQASFSCQDMTRFTMDEQFDVITCFLYSIHYSGNIDNLKSCIASTYAALKPGGIFCFNAVDKTTIENTDGIKSTVIQGDSQISFQSGWRYPGEGERQTLQVRIERKTGELTETWEDQHPMVAVSFVELRELLAPWFEVHMFEHAYDRIAPWQAGTGNAFIVAIKPAAATE